MQGCKRFRRPMAGLTLVEVVVSVALLSTLLVMLLSIQSAHVRQIRDASLKSRSIEMLDRQLAFWFESDEGIPVGQSGGFDVSEPLVWQTSLIDSDGDPKWNATTVRVEAVHRESREVVSQIEIVVPVDQQGQ